MNQGMQPRGFSAIPGAPGAPGVAANQSNPGGSFLTPTPPPAPGMAPGAAGAPGADGMIDLLQYGRENGITANSPIRNPDGSMPAVDLLAYGRDAGIMRPGAATGLTPSPAMAQQPVPPPPPQTERVNPLSGDTSKVAPGQSAPFTPPPPISTNAQHVGGEGSYMRSFSNPHSAGMYDSYVKGLFGGAKTSPAARSPLTRTPAQPAYAGI